MTDGRRPLVYYKFTLWALGSGELKIQKSVTLTLRPCTGMGMLLHKILDKALSSHYKWIKSIEGFAKKLKLKNVYHKTFI